MLLSVGLVPHVGVFNPFTCNFSSIESSNWLQNIRPSHFSPIETLSIFAIASVSHNWSYFHDNFFNWASNTSNGLHKHMSVAHFSHFLCGTLSGLIIDVSQYLYWENAQLLIAILRLFVYFTIIYILNFS